MLHTCFIRRAPTRQPVVDAGDGPTTITVTSPTLQNLSPRREAQKCQSQSEEVTHPFHGQQSCFEMVCSSEQSLATSLSCDFSLVVCPKTNATNAYT